MPGVKRARLALRTGADLINLGFIRQPTYALHAKAQMACIAT